MKSQLPTRQEIEELMAYQPRLYSANLAPIDHRGGGTTNQNRVLTLPWPEYNQVVEEFFSTASRDCWSDNKYRPEEAGRMLENEEAIRNATLAQVRTMLTFCVRGERFCEGHWATVIEQGHIRRLLERLVELK